MSTTLLFVGIGLGAMILGAILIFALKSALGPGHQQHGQSDGNTGIGVNHSHHSKNHNDDDSGTDDSGTDDDGD